MDLHLTLAGKLSSNTMNVSDCSLKAYSDVSIILQTQCTSDLD